MGLNARPDAQGIASRAISKVASLSPWWTARRTKWASVVSFVRGFGRIGGAQIVGEETMRRAGIEAEQGTVSILPGGGVTGTEAHAHESEFDNGSGVKLGLLVQP